MRLVILLGLLLLLPPLVPASTPVGQAVRLIVGVPADLDLSFLDSLPARIVDRSAELGWVVIETGDPRRVREDLQQRDVRYVEEDLTLRGLSFTPNDPYYGEQWGLPATRAPSAWDRGLGATSTSICTVDTGIRSTHEAVRDRYIDGRDFVEDDDVPQDAHGHGTRMAAIAAATVDDGVGMAGVGNFGIRAGKAFDSGGKGTVSAIAKAIQWCGERSHVVLIGYASPIDSPTIRGAVAAASWAGAYLVAPAGNVGCLLISYPAGCIFWPAAYREVVAVTCMTASRQLCPLTNQGTSAELTAPGEQILGATSGSDRAYGFGGGTSASAAFVAGAAALLWSREPLLLAEEVRRTMNARAEDVGSTGRDLQFGYGLVNANADPLPRTETRPLGSVIFSASFDGGSADGFALSGMWHVSSRCASAYSSPFYLGFHRRDVCMYEDPGKTPAGSATFEVDLAGATEATLRFRQRWMTESRSSLDVDVRFVEVAGPDGTWQALRTWSARGENNPYWLEELVVLDTYAGDRLQVRFRFDASDPFWNVYEGWFVDQVEVDVR